MKYTKVLLGKEARDALKRGVDAVSVPVGMTMGAKGRNGVYRQYGSPVITNDGVSIARQIKPKDEFERMGADLVKEAAEKTNYEAGDGTTTSIVLASALIDAGLASGKDPMSLMRELEESKNDVVSKIKAVSRPCNTDEDLMNVARISVEDEGMAKIVTDATVKAGKRGAIIVEEGVGNETEIDIVQRYFWERGYVSPYMITNLEKNEAVLDNPVVIVTDRYLNLNKDLIHTLDGLLKSGCNSAFLVCDKLEGELLASVITNRMKGIFTLVAVQRPGTAEELEDIATLVGATAVTKERGIKNIEVHHCGKAKKVIVTKDKCTIVAEPREEVAARIKLIESEIDADKDNELPKERLAKLSDGIIVIKVGAKTEAERKYRKLKFDDAVSACKSALEEGIVQGAGVTLYNIAGTLESGEMKAALRAPYERILNNAGIAPDGKYYNVKTGEEIHDLFSHGIIDPAKVTRCAVENAVSLAAHVLTIESIIVEVEEKEVK
jgi:chaperonin GroEL